VQESAEHHGWTETAVRIFRFRRRRSVEKKLAKPRHTKRRTGADKAREALTPGFNMQNLEAKVA